MTELECDTTTLPPSSKLILWALEADPEGELTHQDLLEETDLHASTLRYGIDRLKDEGLVDSRTSTSDARHTVYMISN